MHTHNLSNGSHDPIFDTGNQAAERGTRIVMWITAAMMVFSSIERIISPQPIHYQEAVHFGLDTALLAPDIGRSNPIAMPSPMKSKRPPCPFEV
jgi:hypothetical protein